MPALAPRVAAFRDEADRRAPNRRRTSDGGYVDKPGGHNVGERGLVHAYDLGQSMPGTPYWEPGFDQFDVWGHCFRIAREYIAATDAQRKARWRWLYDGGYMHCYDAARRVDIIFNPKMSLAWRVDNNPPGEHFQHAHLEAGRTVAAENDTQPIFGEDDDMPLNKADLDAVRSIVKQELATILGGASTVPKTTTIVGVVKHYVAPLAAKLK